MSIRSGTEWTMVEDFELEHRYRIFINTIALKTKRNTRDIELRISDLGLNYEHSMDITQGVNDDPVLRTLCQEYSDEMLIKELFPEYHKLNNSTCQDIDI